MEKTKSILDLGPTNIENIKNYVLGLSEEKWDEWQYRQKTYRYVNYHTKSIPFLWTDSNFFSDTIEVQIMNCESEVHNFLEGYHKFLENYYDGYIVKSLLIKLRSNGRIAKHVDSSPLLESVHRCHIPIITNKNVIFGIDENEYNLKEGIIYEVNNITQHYVFNRSDQDRVHLLIDVFPKRLGVEIKKYEDQSLVL